MTDFTVELSSHSAPSQWGGLGRLSMKESGAVIHLQETGDCTRTIKKAARQLDGFSLPSVTLVGQWSFEQQWAFALSFTRARNATPINFADNADKAKLESFYSALVFTRAMVNETPEELSPEHLANRAADWITSLAPECVTTEMVVGEALNKEGWVGIYNVGRGSERPPVMLHLDYNPTGDINAPVHTVLVGKGITFDSGGYSIKSSECMLDMKCDMGGAATVTGALGLAILQGLDKRVKLILCCAENLISGHAYKLGDVLTYANGLSVEIVNTDAEGRLVLADGLLKASACNPKWILDAATLTGAALVALGQDYHGVFTLDDEARDTILSCASDENEKFWPLPLEPFHQERCPSAFADTANSRPQKGGGFGGASNAAGFLSRFVPNEGAGWIHLDLAAAYHGSATSEMPIGATGLGIRSIANLLLTK